MSLNHAHKVSLKDDFVAFDPASSEANVAGNVLIDGGLRFGTSFGIRGGARSAEYRLELVLVRTYGRVPKDIRDGC